MNLTEDINNEVNHVNENKGYEVFDHENTQHRVDELNSFRNNGYEEDNNDDSATIEPSESFTANIGRRGQMYLGIASYDV